MARILLLEDNDRFARAVEQVLNQHRVTHVRTVEDAIAELEGAHFDCALIDLNLTDDDDYSGREVLSYLMRSRPDLPRAVVTGSPLEGSIHRNIFLRYGVADIIIKGDVGRQGYATRDLVDTVSDLLSGSEERRRGAAVAEVERISAAATAELDKRMRALQDIADQLGQGRFRRDATAKQRSAVRVTIDSVLAHKDAAVVQFGRSLSSH